MARSAVEKCFREVFAAFSVHFVLAIEMLGWDCLIYQPMSFYVPNRVEDFYDGFVKSDISDD